MTGRPLLNGNGERRYRYGCRVFSDKGPSACAYAGTIQEDVVVDVVLRKLQAEVFSDTAIERLLVAYRKRLAERRRIVPADDSKLRRRIEDLDRQIDQGLDRVLSAPETIVGALYVKIEKLREERDRLKAQLKAPGQAETDATARDDAKVEEAARVLRGMREAFADAKRAEIRDLLSPLVSKIELHHSHSTVPNGKRQRHTCEGGTIFVRPTDPGLSILFGISAG